MLISAVYSIDYAELCKLICKNALKEVEYGYPEKYSRQECDAMLLWDLFHKFQVSQYEFIRSLQEVDECIILG